MATFGQLSTDPKQAQLLPLGAPEPTGGAFDRGLYTSTTLRKSTSVVAPLTQVVLRGLDPRIHVFASTALRRGCPRIEVRGLKAHGPSPAKTKLAGEFLPLIAARFFPGQPCAVRGRRDPARRRRVGEGVS